MGWLSDEQAAEKKFSGCHGAFSVFKFVFLCDTKVSSSPQCCSICHPKRSFQRCLSFPISAWQFLKIQQLFLSIGHSTREGSYFGCSVLPASDICHFSLLSVGLLFLKKSTFTLRYPKAFYFVSPPSSSIALIWEILVPLIKHPPMCRQSFISVEEGLRGSRKGLC